MVVQSLDLMWKGMLCIFLAITVVFIVVYLLNVFTNAEKRNKLFSKIGGFFRKLFKKKTEETVEEQPE